MKKTKSLDDDKLINIKVENKDQIISNFSYDENDRLNKDLSESFSRRVLRIKK